MKKAMMMMWAAPCGKCVEVAYVISTCYLSSDDHRTQFIHSWFPHFILLYYYYFPCVRVSRVRQAMSRARILSTYCSWVGRLECPVQALGIGIALRTEMMEIGGGFD